MAGDLLEVVAVDDHRRWSNGLDALVPVCAALGPRILDDAGVRRVGAHVAKDVRHRRAGRREVGQRVHEQVVRLRDVHVLLRYCSPRVRVRVGVRVRVKARARARR